MVFKMVLLKVQMLKVQIFKSKVYNLVSHFFIVILHEFITLDFYLSHW